MTNKTSNKISSTKPSESNKKLKVPSWLLEKISEASKNTRKIYFLYIGFLIYSAITVVSTSDRQIILNDSVRLPILKMDVSLDYFFILAPLITIFIYIYLQSFLSIRKDLINRLKTYYPQIGREHLYPWILVALDYPKQGLSGRFQSTMVKFSVRFSLPLVLAIISTWFVKKHDPILTYIIGLAPAFGAIIVLWFWLRYENVKFKKSQILKLILNNLGKNVLIFIVVAYEIIFIFFIIPCANEGFPQVGRYESNENKTLYLLKSFFCVDLSYQVVVTKPDVDYEETHWAVLNGVHLEGAMLAFTVLKRADLREAHLKRAKMNNVNLKEANLEDADLEGANLEKAKLQGANLWNANLQSADLEGANLQKAELWLNDLRGANLAYANLKEAILGKAKLQGANLWFSNLQGANFWLANLHGANLFKANLKKAILEGSNLQEAKLQLVDFQEANFIGAELQDADLQRADLRNVLNLTVKQLSVVRTLYNAKLDSDLRKQIEEKYPHLLEEPKPEEGKKKEE